MSKLLYIIKSLLHYKYKNCSELFVFCHFTIRGKRKFQRYKAETTANFAFSKINIKMKKKIEPMGWRLEDKKKRKENDIQRRSNTAKELRTLGEEMEKPNFFTSGKIEAICVELSHDTSNVEIPHVQSC
ncbi:hypothetical protein RCL_jg12110.t1 [Rhizophagus clarus]|uniref:Uncharacterized protein n=1 Tax=Rhizophagus clarus TaxID=94130 RepID=A0A8H3KWG9_9GLOM|nr:hypothetical protein RCL_jg12110.t1 [Rhizophagus clarus]